jgi:hypothetical protein
MARAEAGNRIIGISTTEANSLATATIVIITARENIAIAIN